MTRKKGITFDLKKMIHSHFKQVEEIKKQNKKRSKEFDKQTEEILNKIRSNENDFQ